MFTLDLGRLKKENRGLDRGFRPNFILMEAHQALKSRPPERCLAVVLFKSIDSSGLLPANKQARVWALGHRYIRRQHCTCAVRTNLSQHPGKRPGVVTPFSLHPCSSQFLFHSQWFLTNKGFCARRIPRCQFCEFTASAHSVILSQTSWIHLVLQRANNLPVPAAFLKLPSLCFQVNKCCLFGVLLFSGLTDGSPLPLPSSHTGYAGLVSCPAFILGLWEYLVTSNILKVVLYVFLPGPSVSCAFNTGVEIEKLCSCHVHSSQNPINDLHFSFHIMFV